jgi:hypothetical protein
MFSFGFAGFALCFGAKETGFLLSMYGASNKVGGFAHG